MKLDDTQKQKITAWIAEGLKLADIQKRMASELGLTLTYMQDILRARNPRMLRTACLLSKPSRRQVDVRVEYIGFPIADRFVVGYGLDYAEQYRNLPHIAVLDSQP